MPASRLPLILVLVLLAGLPHPALAHGVAAGAMPNVVRLSACTVTPPVALVLPGVTKTTQAHILSHLSQGNVPAAIAAWELHTGRNAPRAALGLQSAFNKAHQVAGACIRVARAVYDGFKSLGLEPQLVRFAPPSAKTRLLGWEMQAGVERSTLQISDTGRHFAVKVGKRIYDAFTGPAGLLLEDYLQRLHSPAGRPVMQVVESLP